MHPRRFLHYINSHSYLQGERRQGCVLAPTLFNACIDGVMGEMVGKTDCGISLGEATITDLDLADDAVVFAEKLEVFVHARTQ